MNKDSKKTSSEPEKDGKTFADILGEILGSRKKFITFLLVLASFWATLLASLFFGIRIMGTTPKEIQLSATGSHIVFNTSDKDKKEYFVLLQPQGWQNTEIQIKKGDRMEIRAQGKVHISLESLITSVRNRRELEKETMQKKALDPSQDADPTKLPERFFDPSEYEREEVRIKPKRSWIGPEGYSGQKGIDDSAFPARKANKILPDSPYGALIGTVHISNNEPERFNNFSGAFYIGNSKSVSPWSGDDGKLWLIVNDVLDDSDPVFPEKFYIDNIGFFFVQIILTKE